MKFRKMHGLGNSFILADNRDGQLDYPDELAREICNVNFGIGADGLILVENSEKCDFRMRIYNADGSEPEMCGNGIRCFSKYLKDMGITDKTSLQIQTGAGTIGTEIISESGNISQVKVNMGAPAFESADFAGDNPDNIQLDGRRFVYVSMGNPHAITFVKEFEFDYDELGEEIENNTEIFPNRTNVEFIRVDDSNEISMRVWERGCGETLACGTGACASVVAGIKQGKVQRVPVTVHLRGGDLVIEWLDDGPVMMTGPAADTCEGEYFMEAPE